LYYDKIATKERFNKENASSIKRTEILNKLNCPKTGCSSEINVTFNYSLSFILRLYRFNSEQTPFFKKKFSVWPFISFLFHHSIHFTSSSGFAWPAGTVTTVAVTSFLHWLSTIPFNAVEIAAATSIALFYSLAELQQHRNRLQRFHLRIKDVSLTFIRVSNSITMVQHHNQVACQHLHITAFEPELYFHKQPYHFQ
jgi:hypothetical protein